MVLLRVITRCGVGIRGRDRRTLHSDTGGGNIHGRRRIGQWIAALGRPGAFREQSSPPPIPGRSAQIESPGEAVVRPRWEGLRRRPPIRGTECLTNQEISSMLAT